LRPLDVVGRVAIVLACVVGIVVFAGRREDADACEQARAALFSAGLKHQAPEAKIDAVADRCKDPETIAVTAAGVTTAGHPDLAARLARIAVRRGPDEFASWAALSQALRRSDPAGSRRAAARARALNPRWGTGAGP
jgi:hypothetical protein